MVHKSSLVKSSERQAAIIVLNALGEPRRIEILHVLKSGPRPVGEIASAVGVSQQAASQHLAVLNEAGLVEARREGTRRLYAIRPDGFAPVAAFVDAFWGPRLERLKAEIEKKR
jgi:DNA-binding transcriptional ArsR family regulator